MSARARRITLTTALAAGLALACASAPRQDVLGAQRALGREFLRDRNWPRAFAVAEALCRDHPDDPEGFILRGTVLREQDMLVEAEADLKEALLLDPASARAHSAIGILYDMQGLPEKALEHHERAAKLDSRNAQFLNNLGFSLFAHGRAREAIETLHEAARVAPAEPRIRNNLGFAYAAAGDMTRAAEQFRLGGTPAEAKNNLGWAYERRGSLALAFELYAEAVRIDPGSALSRTNLLRVAQALGKEVPADMAPVPGS